jgi:hypothetical protein
MFHGLKYNPVYLAVFLRKFLPPASTIKGDFSLSMWIVPDATYTTNLLILSRLCGSKLIYITLINSVPSSGKHSSSATKTRWLD